MLRSALDWLAPAAIIPATVGPFVLVLWLCSWDVASAAAVIGFLGLVGVLLWVIGGVTAGLVGIVWRAIRSSR